MKSPSIPAARLPPIPVSPGRRHRAWWWVVVLLALPMPTWGQIESVTRTTADPLQYGRVDFVVLLTATWNNPFRSEEVRLDLELQSPSGENVVVPAYFETGTSGATSVWQVRFTPVDAGEYRGAATLAGSGIRSVSAPVLFRVAPTSRRGFLRPRDPWTFRFDNGEPFRGIGENLGWESRHTDDSRFFRELNQNARYNYDYLLGRLAASGGNFFRTWMCPWNLPLEWKTVTNPDRYTNDPAPFNGSAARRMDELVARAESLAVTMMLTLDYSVGDWEINSYSRKNGGPAQTPTEFFTDPAARAQYRNRLRYLVARWGYSPSIGAWEFFNEIDNVMYGQPQPIPDSVVTAWHDEMSAFLKTLDPYHHLITTSISHRDVAGLNRVSHIDFNQRHIYRNTQGIPAALREYSARDGKPYVIGEFAYEWDWNKDFDQFAGAMDADFKRGLWLGLFSPTPILPLSWWWEFFERRGMMGYFPRVRLISDEMMAAGHGSFVEVESRFDSAAVATFAVRCGGSFFVLLDNETPAVASGRLSLPALAGHRWAGRIYDPERNGFAAVPPEAAPEGTIGPIAIEPRSELIVVAAPIVALPSPSIAPVGEAAPDRSEAESLRP